MDPDFEGRVLVVANRLPISIIANADGTFDYAMASGGLVSGLKSLAKVVDFKWFGWPGIDVHRNDKDNVRRHLQDQYNAVPIFLTEDVAQRHYNGFSSTLRPTPPPSMLLPCCRSRCSPKACLFDVMPSSGIYRLCSLAPAAPYA